MIRIRIVAAAMVGYLSMTSHAAKPKMKVTVIAAIPTTSTYNWQVAGRGSVSCSGSGCSTYYMPASSGTSQVSGAILRLLLPDGRIVIAGCDANRGNIGFGIVGAITGDSNLNSPRNCGVPDGQADLEAEFNGSLVKLFWRLPSIDGTGRKTSETYSVRGVLQPTAASENVVKITANPDIKARMEANDTASGNSPEAAATRAINESAAWAAWKSMTPAERAQFVKEGKASLFVIVTTPAGAEIDIDGVKAGVTPMKGALLRHGDDYRMISIKMPGFVTVEKKFIPNGKNIPIGITLVPETNAGAKP